MNCYLRLLPCLLVWIVMLTGGRVPSRAVADEPARTGPQTEARFPPLVVPPGFKATLFACDPLIEYPSVIAAGSRPGAIFVAVDYMTGLGTEIVRRSEVRLVEDTDGDGYADEAKVAADGFNSIQGLAWHDGTLFVMHAPHLTAVHMPQNGSGPSDRKDLLSGLGLTPEDNPVRLHCANGVVAGHDGWLYLSLGDNGASVPRPEGDRLVLHGGGILRCRPDGRDLHVFATGLRNIYDVALDAELNVFVRDNENDGGTYKIRVCHSFHGADHGYPFLYDTRPDEALPPLADLGLGSSAGGVAYLETQFPAEYRGNLFFCEWGKSLVRYPLTRRGASFAPVTEIDFAAGARGDPYGFKPTDVIVQRDGSMMVSDYADGQRPKRGRGRIYQITSVGEGASPARPVAARGGSPEQWLVQLDSESHFERCKTQKALEQLGQQGGDAIHSALSRKALGVRGRCHAVWILAHTGGESSIRQLLELAESDSESSVRAQAIRAVADLSDPILVAHRLDVRAGDEQLAKQLAALAKGQDGALLLEIVVALGRLRWRGVADWLRETLQAPDPTIAHAAMQALRRSGNWSSILSLVDAADEEPLRVIALRALAEHYEPVVADGLLQRLQAEKQDSRQLEYADLLARTYKQPGPWVYWGYRPGPRPPNTETWERTDAIAAALADAIDRASPPMRLTILRSMQRERVPIPLQVLAAWLSEERHAERVAAILKSLQDQPADELRPLLGAVVQDPQHHEQNRLLALSTWTKITPNTSAGLVSLCQRVEDGPVLAAALRQFTAEPISEALPLLLSKLTSPASAVRAAATEVLGEWKIAELGPSLAALLADQDPAVRQAAATAAGKLAHRPSSETLLRLVRDTDLAVQAASLEALASLDDSRAIPHATLALHHRQVTVSAMNYLARLGGPEQAEAIAAAAKHDPSSGVLKAAVSALHQWRSRNHPTLAEKKSIDQSIAAIQGACGVVMSWHCTDPLPADLANSSTISESIQLDDFKLAAIGDAASGHVKLASRASGEASVWFAQTLVRVDEQTPVEFFASAGGKLQVWLNGESIFRPTESKPFRLDSDRFRATLAKGNNRLLVSVIPSSGGPEFHLRFRQRSAQADHERLIQAALARPGNPERGRTHFLNLEKSQCLKCHRLGEQGQRIGPELTSLGSRFSRIFVIESILQPSRHIAPSFGSLAVLLGDGRTIVGLLAAETQTHLTLADQQGQLQVILKSQIEMQQPSPQSTMPEGLEKRLTEQEFVDLIAYLMSLTSKPNQ